MARISLKEQYDNKDVITQIYGLKDKETANADAIANTQTTADIAIAQAQDAVAKADAAVSSVSGYDTRIDKAQGDATLALTQAEDAQTDADKGVAVVSIITDAASGTLYTKTVANVEESKNIPLASTTQTGLMNAQTYQGLVNLGVRVSALEAKKSTAYVVFTSNDPSQEEITQKFTAVVGRAPIAGDQVTDIAKALTYEYDGTTWIQTTAPIANWTNETAGIIKGTPASGAAGTIFAETDGTGSVNGWDELNTTVSKAFSGFTFTETATKVTAKFDAVDGVTSVAEDINAANESTAGILTAADWSKFNGKQNALTSVQVTLTAVGWLNNTQTIVVGNVEADNIIWVSPSSASFDSYVASGIRATVQQSGSLTFSCITTPVVDIIVEVVA